MPPGRNGKKPGWASAMAAACRTDPFFRVKGALTVIRACCQRRLHDVPQRSPSRDFDGK
jgi:hypothetical protein